MRWDASSYQRSLSNPSEEQAIDNRFSVIDDHLTHYAVIVNGTLRRNPRSPGSPQKSLVHWEISSMRHIVFGLALIVGCPASNAFADFVMTLPTAPPDALAAGAVGWGQTEGETLPPVAPTFKVAQGFGERISLSFAVRQIIPRAVKVSFGSGADPTALVDWKGGRPWNQVLRDAVEPLGLRLVMTTTTVEIRRK